jgi:two-component system, OmpR family, sensor histidine kinase BaeS
MYKGKSLSLRWKLMLSYLGVALGAILLLVIIVSFVVENYFYQAQIGQLRGSAFRVAQEIVAHYQSNNNSWTNLQFVSDFGPFLAVEDTQGQLHTPPLPGTFTCFEPQFEQAIARALHGQEDQGSLQGTTSDGDLFSGLYISEPIWSNNQIIGAVLLVQPESYQENVPSHQQGFSASDILAEIRKVILIAGLGIALIVIGFSLFMTRHLTRPLVSLTQAAEEMKAGNYARRVEPPKSADELGRLAATFNSMADKIEADVNALRIQEQLRRDLTANIAHDLVTPLTAIQGYSEAIADNVISEPAERQETALLIGREVQRLRRLVSDMQNMTALEAGRAQMELAPLDMYDLVTETLAVIAPECEQAQIELHNEIPPATPSALADSDRIAQVLLNLLDNARRHTPAGGQITIGARPEGQWLVVWVKDTGVGINPQNLPYIFERFYRVDRSRNAASGGSGLGLAIIKAIIVGHGGTAWADSTPGQGTTILFTLLLAPTSAPTQPLKPVAGRS